MKLCILIMLTTLCSLVWAGSATLEEPQQTQQDNPAPSAESMTSLMDDADMGGQHAEEGARNARFFWPYWGGGWSYSYYPRYYSRPWGGYYRRYWW